MAFVRPAFWPLWYPERCERGHWLTDIRSHWVNHDPDCPANTDGHGHHVITCENDHCGQFIRPPECTEAAAT